MSILLGIDIGTTNVKVAVIRTAYRKVQLTALTSAPVSGGDAASAVTAAVRAAIGAGGADSVAACIDGSKATVRVVGLPSRAGKQVADVLPFELESILPFDLSDAVFDFRVLPGFGDTKGEELRVLVGVAKVADVSACIETLKTAISMEPERVGLGAFPVANLVPYLPVLAEGTVAIIDLGRETSDVVVLSDGEPVFARSTPFGTSGLPASATRLGRELRTTLGAYRAQGGEAPRQAYLCGGGAYEAGAEAFLSTALDAPVETLAVPTLDAITLSPEITASLALYAKALGLAIGLTTRQGGGGLNLRRGVLAFERGFAWIRERMPLLAGLSAVLVVSFAFSAWAQLYARGRERDVLEKALSLVSRDVLGEETTSASRAAEILATSTGANDEDPLPHADAFDVMVVLSQVIPTTMTHDIEELDVQKGHVVVHGIVGSIPDAQQIQTNIAKERCFMDSKISRTTAQPGTDRQKYVLEFDLRCPEDAKGKKASGGTSSAAASSASGGK